MNVDTVRIGSALRAELDRRGLSQDQVAAAFNVTQSRISRVLQGEFTKRSELVPLLCAAYLEGAGAPDLESYAHNEVAQQAFQRATQALRRMWDGTADHADRLAIMIEAVRRSRMASKSEHTSA